MGIYPIKSYVDGIITIALSLALSLNEYVFGAPYNIFKINFLDWKALFDYSDIAKRKEFLEHLFYCLFVQ